MKYFKLILIACVLILGNYSFASDSPEQDWFYTLKKGDFLSDICEEHVQLPVASCMQKLKYYNQLSKLEFKAGKEIKIPVKWLKEARVEVKVLSQFGEVFYKKSNSSKWLALVNKDFLHVNEALKTKKGNAKLEFSDGSLVWVNPETELVISVLEIGGKDMGKVQLLLNKGSVDNHVKKRQKGIFEIITPAGVAAVRGTKFRVRVTENGESFYNEVLAGEVAVKQDDKEKFVFKNFGVKAIKEQGVTNPKRLLPAPVFNLKKSKLNDAALVKIDWAKIPSADVYQYEIYRGEELLLKSQRKNSNLFLSFDQLGAYHVLVRPIDKQGFEGLDARLDFELGSDS